MKSNIRYRLIIYILTWIASALVGYALLAVADSGTLQPAIAIVAGYLGFWVFFASPFLIISEAFSSAYSEFEGFKSFATPLLPYLSICAFFLIAFVIFTDQGLELLKNFGNGYFDLVGSFLINSPDISDVKEAGPVNLGDILDAR